MRSTRFTDRLSRATTKGDYLLGLLVAAIAVLMRAGLDAVYPGVAPFIVLFPAIVLVGAFCGPGPAALAAMTGGAATARITFGDALLAWPPPHNTPQIDTLLALPACATVLWATSTLRRIAACAALAEARLAEVFRQIPGTAAIIEAPSGRVLLRSAQSDAVLGHPQIAVTSGDLKNYGGLHPDGRPFAADDYPINRALRTGEVVEAERVTYRRPDGTIAQLEVHAGPVLDARGRVIASVGMAFDITDRVEAETRLIASEARHRAAAERLAAAIDAGALGLWEMDIASQQLRLDGRAAAMLGLPAEPIELPRAAVQAHVHPDDQARTRERFDRALEGGGGYSDEYCFRSDSGETRWVVSVGAALPDLRIAVGVISDVTDRRRREEALQAALQARDVLMHEADHRIKNSLQLVVSLLRLQLARVPDPDARHALAQAISRVDAVANAHLSLQASPDLRHIEIDTLLQELCLRVGSLNPALTVTCDATSLLSLDAEQAIPLGLLASEFLTNALRHAYAPGACGRVALTSRATDGALTIAVTDDGVGLPPGGARSGLGTTVIATLARQIGATVTRDSSPGRGTSIAVVLPVGGDAGRKAESVVRSTHAHDARSTHAHDVRSTHAHDAPSTPIGA
jgi:PAS domain S-box-containing protein